MIAPPARDQLRDLPARKVLRQLGVTWWKLPMVAQALRQRMTDDLGGIRLFAWVARADPAEAMSVRALVIVSAIGGRGFSRSGAQAPPIFFEISGIATG